MAHRVGSRGQVVIEKAIRDRLGVQPGWRTLQALVGDRVELRFLPPPHRRSLAGCLAPYVDPSTPPPTEEEIDEAFARGALHDWLEREPDSGESH